NRGVQRRVSLSGWSFDEHRPPQFRNSCIGRENLLASQVRLRGKRPWRTSECRLHLAKVLKVPLLQHQTDVGMGDEIPLMGDDIGVPSLTYLDLRNDLPDVLEIHLSDQNTDHLSGERLDGDSNAHVWLRLPHEIH